MMVIGQCEPETRVRELGRAPPIPEAGVRQAETSHAVSADSALGMKIPV
jgi:hypothetical protein